MLGSFRVTRGENNISCVDRGSGQSLQYLDYSRDVAPSMERRLIAYGGSHFTMLSYRIERFSSMPVNDPGGHSRNQMCLLQEKHPWSGEGYSKQPRSIRYFLPKIIGW
jgi:hypothetical protein